MSHAPAFWKSPLQHIRAERPLGPVMYFSPGVLQATYRAFAKGFPGLVTYAVKANDTDMVLENLVAAGMASFDVASPFEMQLVRRVFPRAVLHYNNPVRSREEVAFAVTMDVASYSVDCLSELKKLVDGGVPAGSEVSARLRLPVKGGHYDFGAKFGADPDKCVELLREIARSGYVPAMTFHPGTQCCEPGAWAAYIERAAGITREAGIDIARLNVGGGFPSHRTGFAPDLGRIFDTIARATKASFGPRAPFLVCEPGRAMVADSFALACRVKAIRDDGALFLDDGIYGGLAEMPLMGMIDRIEVLAPDGDSRKGPKRGFTVFGPTCDSVDRMPGSVDLPKDVAEGDYVIVHGAGAYSTATVTHFNGYGHISVTTVDRFA